MITDGGHKRQQDQAYFKLDLELENKNSLIDSLSSEFNARNVVVYLYKNEKNWKPIQNNQSKKIPYDMSIMKEAIVLKAQ